MRTALATQTPLNMGESEEGVQTYLPPSFSGTGVIQTFSISPGGRPNGEANAATSRAAARMIAAKIPEEEVERLLRGRRALVEKKLAGTISKREELELKLIDWSLDRIEDARYGASLDRLEQAVQMQNDMASKIDSFARQLNDFIQRKPPR